MSEPVSPAPAVADRPRDESLQARCRRKTSDPCPCCYVKPCHPRCSCVSMGSSHGCSRCCRYGSVEQRTERAERLARLIDAGMTIPVAPDEPGKGENVDVSA